MAILFKSLWIQALVGLMLMTGASAPAQAQSFDRTGAVILAYQRVGEDIYPATSISKEQFTENIQELLDGDYHIASLDEIVNAIKADEKLPDRTVAITFDGAYRSILDNAVPLLLSHNLPFTVFFSSDQADGNTPQYMDWNDVRRLNKYPGVTLGLHSAGYSRLTDSPPGEIRRQVNKALTRYRQELKGDPAFFAYPFGEYTKAYREIIATSEF
ncbi:MAG TPA: polysaccharide deacetylase family protein, partial [Micavibrio sp.]